ncbi:MAG: shikimate kinase [Flavobacterium sp.]|nr:shikimate kinase [Flavobacterium sp.]
MKKIILIGYMGSGKSVAAQILHEKLQIKLADLDREIEQKSDRTISRIFSQKGEIHFRKLESMVLAELIKEDIPMIISLGGGTPCYANNLDIIRQSDATTFYLKASAQTLAHRLSNETSSRPLISTIGHENLPEFINKHLFERSPFYLQADHIIQTDDKTPLQIADEIISIVSILT